MGNSEQGCELCLRHRRENPHCFCCGRGEQGRATEERGGLSSTILWDWGHSLLVPTFC